MLGTPIISTDVGVARELVERYDCGDLVPYGEKELAAVLLRYLDRYDGRRPDFSVGDEYELKTEVEKTVRLLEKAMERRDRNAKLKKLPYPEVTIHDYELDAFEIRRDKTFILRVMQGGVPYEYLIRRRSGNDKLIVFHNGAVPEGNVRYPVFQRHSWAELLKTSSVFCMDPTLYLNSYLQLGWGVGRNETYYLEKSSLILRKIIAKMGIRLTDTVIYGTSGGGYLSAITGIYLRGATVVADNAQLDVRNWRTMRVTLALSAAPDIVSNPTDIVLVLDCSGSMAGAPPAPVAAAARAAGIVIYCIGLVGADGVDANVLNEWATDPDASHVAVTPDAADLENLFADLAVNISKPGATKIVIDEEVNSDFAIVSVSQPDKGSAMMVDAHRLQWNIEQLDVTVKNVCPNRRVALAIILTEMDENGMEYQRGMKAITIPAHQYPTCRDVLVKCVKFVLPEDLNVSGGTPRSLCGPRNLKVRFIAHNIDTDYRCCELVATA